jgi:hypothetical protein
MRWANLKIKEGLAYLSLDLIYDLKGKSQKLFRENVPLISGTFVHAVNPDPDRQIPKLLLVSVLSIAFNGLYKASSI